MKDTSQQHFDNISRRYHRASDAWQTIYDDQVKRRIDPLIVNKVVLDVGNGGRFSYSTALPSQIIAMDISSSMLDQINAPNIVKVVGDARDMKTIPDRSVDVIVFQFVLHHINGSNVSKSLQTLDAILASSSQKLKIGGHLVIAETILPPLLFSIQCFLFHLTRSFLNLFGVPMIFFFSLPVLERRIAQIFQLQSNEIDVLPIQLQGWIDPIPASFPGLIKIPVWLLPTDMKLLIVNNIAK